MTDENLVPESVPENVPAAAEPKVDETPVAPEVKPVEIPENYLFGTVVTLDGLQEVRNRGGERVAVDMPEEEFRGFPRGWKDKNRIAFDMCCMYIQTIKNANATLQPGEPRRDVPLLRNEAVEVMKIAKKELRTLVDYGFLGEESVPLMNPKTNKVFGNRAVLFLTPQGKALRKQLDTKQPEVEPMVENPYRAQIEETLSGILQKGENDGRREGNDEGRKEELQATAESSGS